MDSINIDTFKVTLKECFNKVIDNHKPIKINDENGKSCIIISVEDWEKEQETLYILQNQDLMKQISESIKTHNNHQGYFPSNEEINEIFSF